MPTQRKFDISSGPNRYALFDGFLQRSPLNFVVNRESKPREFKVLKMEREEGSGIGWLIKAVLVNGRSIDVTAPFKGYYNTSSKTGYLETSIVIPPIPVAQGLYIIDGPGQELFFRSLSDGDRLNRMDLIMKTKTEPFSSITVRRNMHVDSIELTDLADTYLYRGYEISTGWREVAGLYNCKERTGTYRYID